MTKHTAEYFSILLLFFLILPVTKTFAHGQIGVRLKDTIINNEVKVTVTEVLQNSPAAIAGILPNDILYSLDGRLIKSTLELINNIRTINDSITINIEIYRNETRILKQLIVKIIEDIPVKIKFSRNSIWTTVNTDEFKVVINNEYIRTVPLLQSKLFYVGKTPNNENNCYVSYNNVRGFWGVDTTLHLSTIVRFKHRDGYTTIIDFEYPDLNSLITYEPNDNEIIRLNKKRLDSLELIEYKRIVSDSSLAPKWFKEKTKRSLNSTLDDTIRNSFWTSLVQTTPVVRVFYLYIVLVIIFVMVNFHRNDGVFNGATLYSNPLYLLLYYPCSKIVSWLINLAAYAITGTDYHLPFEFIIFWGLSITIIGGVVYTIKPLHSLMTSGASTFKKILGFVGLALEIIGMIFTILEIFRRVGYPLD